MEEKEAGGGADLTNNLPVSVEDEGTHTSTTASSATNTTNASSSSDDSSGDAMVIHGHMDEEKEIEAVECSRDTIYEPLVDGPTLVAVQ